MTLALNFILGFSEFAAFDWAPRSHAGPEEVRGGTATSGSSGAHNSLPVGAQGRETIQMFCDSGDKSEKIPLIQTPVWTTAFPLWF